MTNTNDSGPGSLRQAILDADFDGSAGTDLIRFAISPGGVQTIAPLSPLPGVTRPTVLDATTQIGYAGSPLIELSGANLPPGFAVGLYVPGSGCTVKGFVINRFTSGDGIRVDGANATVEGNYLGTDVAGTAAQGNFIGVVLLGSNNLVKDNILSANFEGVELAGQGNQIDHNSIGVGATGAALGNTSNGVRVVGGSGNIIGRTDLTVGVAGVFANTIADNGGYGIELTFGTMRDVVEENYIGTDANNTSGLGNARGGVHIDQGSSGNRIGALKPANDGFEFNVISGNGGSGILIEDPGTTGNLVEGNVIGTDSSGFHALANGGAGVLIQNNASGNTIGGASFVSSNFFLGYPMVSGAGNLIAGNAEAGVEVFEATANTVQGNFIGTNISGTGAVPNAPSANFDGIDLLKGAADNQIGGPSSIDGAGRLTGLGNLISGNAADGIFIGDGFTGPGEILVTRNHVEGNFIGTDVTGMAPLANRQNGVHLDGGAVGNFIGGTAPGTRNLISGNGVAGVFTRLFGAGVQIADVFGNGPVRDNLVEGNYIGTDITGGNAVGNLLAGVVLQHGVTGNTIGGTAAGVGNLISGNSQGMVLGDSGTSANLVQGNFIGTDVTGASALGNTLDGILVQNGASGNTVGGSAAGAGNLISGNFGNGVRLFGTGTSGNRLEGNLIGTDATGVHAVGNRVGGVLLEFSATANTVGGASSVDANGNLSGHGNVISGNLNYGVDVVQATGNLVQGNFIGTDRAGKAALPNDPFHFNLGGVSLTDGAVGNQVGGASSVDANGNLSGLGNLISGNGFDGVYLAATNGGAPSSGNLVQGNFIGTDVTGMAALPNQGNGVHIRGGGQNNTVGGTTAALRNIISGNGVTGIPQPSGMGVQVDGLAGTGGVTGNLIEGNYIGTDRTGASALGNLSTGVVIENGPTGNRVGAPGGGNVISGNPAEEVALYFNPGNTVQANFIGLNAAGTAALAGGSPGVHIFGASNNLVGTDGDGVNDAAERNVIAGFVGDGVQIISGQNNVVAGNYIGTDASGLHAVPNGYGPGGGAGVHITTGGDAAFANTGNRIGSNPGDHDVAGERNVIAGNAGPGVQIDGTTTTSNTVAGNYVGTDATGLVALPNGSDGVLIQGGAANNTVGAPGDGNSISGNAANGVRLSGAGTGNVIEANFIGTDATGSHALGNATAGVWVENGSNGNTVGRSSAGGAGNIISGNLYAGVVLLQSSNNVVGANFIGTDVTGRAAVPNGPSGLRADGVDLFDGATSNFIGGSGLGNVISGNGFDGVFLYSQAGTPAAGNFVQGNFIGTDVTGTVALPNQGNGVHLEGGAIDNLIGGGWAALRNVISGNGNAATQRLTRFPVVGAGVQIADFFGVGPVTGNFVQGNYIGIDVTGAHPLGNLTDGVTVQQNANGNTVAGNVISANGNAGVGIYQATNTTVVGNYIGTDPAGTTALGNAHDGVLLSGRASNNTVGGTSAGAGNLISGNTDNGVRVTGAGTTANLVQGNLTGTDAAGAHALGNAAGVRIEAGASGNTVGGASSLDPSGNLAGSGNVISGNQTAGVVLVQASGNFVQGNFIGTDRSSTHALANGADGVLLTGGAQNNTVGGTAFATVNVISGNTANGVRITGAATTGNQVEGNFVGTTIAGTQAVANLADGVRLEAGANHNTVGGAAPGAGNLLSGNAANGVRITDAGTMANLVAGNSIGTNLSSAAPLGNASNGVRIEAGAFGNTVGGPSSLDGSGNLAGPGNVISGNQSAGVDLAGASANFVQGNFIGTDQTGRAGVGNQTDGVLLEAGASNNTVGGTVGLTGAGTGNLLSGNTANGVRLTGTATTGNLIEGNFIGTDVTGSSARANGNDGVLLEAGASGNTVGGPGFTSVNGRLGGPGNVISGNTKAGVDIHQATANQVEGNFLGADATSAMKLSNGTDGVLLDGGSAGNTVGGTTAGAGNLVSYNAVNGVHVAGAGTTGNFVQGNLIGTNVFGTAAQANGNDGALIDAGASGNLIGGSSSVSNGVLAGAGNVISGNSNAGVIIFQASANRVQGNFIGTNRAGNGPVPNDPSGTKLDGVDLLDGATDNEIGGSSSVDGGNLAGLGNLISGNGFDGVFLATTVYRGTPAVGNLVEGNFIGTDVTGMGPLPNNGNDVHFEGGAQNNTIGGTDPSVRNVISGNGLATAGNPHGAGVQIADLFDFGAVTGNVVEGNYIGTDRTGAGALANLDDGVILQHGVTGNTVGGSVAGAGNLISGNNASGVHLTGAGTSHNAVQGNLIGTQEDGAHALPNDRAGITIDGDASGNAVGGVAFVDDSDNLAGAGNVISGNAGSAVFLDHATDNQVQGNFLGTDRTGRAPLGQNFGVFLDEGAADNQIGGLSSLDGRGRLAGLGNLISGNNGDGIVMFSGTLSLYVTGNRVEGNLIGTDVRSTSPMPNHFNGVNLAGGALQNTIGGTVAGTRNIISGNGLPGIGNPSAAGVQIGSLLLSDNPVGSNLIQNNYIGTDVTGLHALRNRDEGVIISAGASHNQVGAPGAGNVIAGNDVGILIQDSTTSGNVVESNTIGLFADGKPSIVHAGVRILQGSNHNQIGLTGAGNIISGNEVGVLLGDAGTSANQVQGNFLGTDTSGSVAVGNAFAGIWIVRGASGNQIGGAGQGNVISGNGDGSSLGVSTLPAGVYISDPGTTGNVLEDNLIGTDVTGTRALGNAYAGVLIRHGATGNLIRRALTGNVISATVPLPARLLTPGAFGVLITGSGTSGNLLTGNLIGTDRTRTQALGNQLDGVKIADGATNTQVGDAGKPNVISGNTHAGVEITDQTTTEDTLLGNRIGTDVTGTLPLGNGGGEFDAGDGFGVLVEQDADSIQIGTGVVNLFQAGGGNVISGNQVGVAVKNDDQRVDIEGNYIGTDVTGTRLLGNAGDGVDIEQGGGGTTVARGNVISSNGIGVLISQGSGQVFGNLIGTDAAGEHALPNTFGIDVEGSTGTTRLGLLGEGNLVSGNRFAIELDNATNPISIQANLIGTDATGTTALPNTEYGIRMINVRNVMIGGTDAGAANVIAANARGGILLVGGRNNVITGNAIGTDLHDQLPLGNGGDGILIGNSAGNTIGGVVDSTNQFNDASANLIEFNHGNGVHESGAGSSGNQILYNFIGTDMDGTADQSNQGAGVRLDVGAQDNTLEETHISFNGQQGIVADFNAGTGNAFIDDSITGNAAGGIDLNDDGPSLNSPGGPHGGPNHLQNYPVVTTAGVTGDTTVLRATLNSTPNSRFNLQFFANDGRDADGNAQGQTPLFAGPQQHVFVLTTDNTGNGTVTVALPVNLRGKYITATATLVTSNNGTLTFEDTSEFSKPVLVGPLTPQLLNVDLASHTEGPQTIAVFGTNFVKGATILLNGVPLTTQFLNDTTLLGQIPPGLTEEGVDEVITVVDPGSDAATSNGWTFTVADAALSLQPNDDPADHASVFEGAPYTLFVARLTDAGGLESLDHYRALITWGDGSRTDGTVKFVDGVTAFVFGTHTYPEEGMYDVTVFVRDDGGQSATTTWTLPVHDAVLKPVGKTVTFTENLPASVVVASFEDADPNGFAGQYAASINWGDGTPPTVGTVTASGSGFDVTGTHTYTRAANVPNTPARYPVSVTITDVGGATTTAAGSAVVTPPPLQPTAKNFPVKKGISFNGDVASFTDPDPRTDSSRYTATITWDDGSTTVGQISGNNPFTVKPQTAHTFTGFTGTHTITVTISDTAGGQGRTVIVTDRIVDPPSESPNGPFVYQLYQDLLGRVADDSGLGYWSAVLDSGAGRDQVVAAITASPEYRTLQVQQVYHTLLHRDADAPGLSYFLALLASGTTVEAVQAQVAGSPEYSQAHGGSTDGFLEALYQDALHRTIDPAGRDFWTRVLAGGPSRADVAAAVFASTEYRQELVKSVYRNFLGRAADSDGLDYWVALLGHGKRDEEVLAGFLGGQEYFERA